MPRAISPVLQKYVDREVIIAKDQPQYMPLPALCTASGKVLTRWSFTHEERRAIALGADLYLCILACHQPLQPILMEVSNEQAVEAILSL